MSTRATWLILHFYQNYWKTSDLFTATVERINDTTISEDKGNILLIPIISMNGQQDAIGRL